MLLTPFEETLYLDGDIRFCSDMKLEFESILSGHITMAWERREAFDYYFNAEVILYRKNRVVATLMLDVIQAIFLEKTGDQIQWAKRLKVFHQFAHIRINVLPPRMYFQTCRTYKDACIVTEEVILLYGHCWLTLVSKLSLEEVQKFCNSIN